MKRLLCWILSLCLLLCLVPGAAAAERVTGTLERRAGYDLAVDGIFGTQTENAALAAQPTGAISSPRSRRPRPAMPMPLTVPPGPTP